MGKGPTLAQGAKHDCASSGCYKPSGGMRWPVAPEHLKWLEVGRSERSGRMCDSTDRVLSEKTVAVALLALNAKEVEALDRIAEADGRVKSYAVLIRRLITREAKALGS